jgi:hypothetical protein
VWGVVERERAQIGVFIFLEEPTKAMRTEAPTSIRQMLVNTRWCWWYRKYTRFKARLIPAYRSLTQ